VTDDPATGGPVERFVAAALRRRVLVLVCLGVLALAGLAALRDLPVEAFPDLTNNQVVVSTQVPGLATTEVEQRITFPIETALMGTPGAQQVRSISKFGLSMVTVVFDDDVPVYFARQLVGERLNEARARLPAGVDPSLGPVATAFGEIYQYLVEGPDLLTTKTLHDWDIRTRLRAVPGVSEVNSWGGLTQQYHVVVDPRRLEKFGLDLHQVVDAVDRNNASFSGGFVEHRAERMTVRGVGLVGGVGDIERIVVTAVDGVPVYVRDVAEVRVGAMPRQGAVTHDGRGEAVSGMTIMLKGENGRDVAARVKARIAEIERTLPEGTTIVPFYDQSTVIARTARTVRRNLLEGSLLVVAVLLLFLRDLRAALIVAAVIPFAMLSGFIGMRLFRVSANLMSLGAIDFGMIVDGAVVMMESFVRHRADVRADADTPERLAMFRTAATEVARPILFGVLIIVAVYLPIFTLEGLEGKLYRPMAITVCSALLGALLLALTGVPVAASYLLRPGGAHHEEGWFAWLRRRYVRHLADALRHRWRTLAVAVTVVSLALGSLRFIGTEFMPRLDEGAILIETRRLPSISLPESVEVATQIERIIGTFPEVESVVSKIGRPDIATEAMGIYQADVYVNLFPIETWTSGRAKEDLVRDMAAALAPLPGVSFNFSQPMAMRLDEVVSGVKADVALKIFGPDLDELARLAEAARQRLARVPGIADLQVEVLSGAAQLEIAIDHQEAARYGVNVSDVQELIETAVGGRTATELLDGARRFAIVVRYPDALRSTRDAIAGLTLTAPGGERIPLARIATLREAAAPEAIGHENGQRRLVVQANVRGRDVGSVVADAKRQLADLTWPAGYFATWGGQFENQERATGRLMLVIPLSLAIIFALLFVTFRTARQAAIVILNVPFALVGGVAGLWLRGLNLSLSASVGFVALFGVAVLNGVVMIAAVNGLRAHGRDLRDAVLQGAGTRLKPVLMTALVAAFGFIPMALSHGAGAEVQRPLATVVIGGIITSTLLTLVVLPTVYELVEERVARRAAATAPPAGVD
jgi:cobalt-zinc-cadmium resistance protein CzcA